MIYNYVLYYSYIVEWEITTNNYTVTWCLVGNYAHELKCG